MKEPYKGTHGHIAIGTPDVARGPGGAGGQGLHL